MFDIATSAADPVQSKKEWMENFLAKEAGLTANCYTVNRYGNVEGTQLDERCSVWVGTSFVARDKGFDKAAGKPFGFVYHPVDGEKVVRRAVPFWIQPRDETKRGFHVLRRPETDEVSGALLKIDRRVAGKIKKDDYELHIYSGFATDGKILAENCGEFLVWLEEGQMVDIFFADGFVSRYSQSGGRLTEQYLSATDTTEMRVAHAHKRLKTLILNEGEKEERERQVRFALYGMADLLQVTHPAGVATQDIRRQILSDFFLKLEPEHLNVVHKKLWAILNRVDSVLLEMIRGNGRKTAELEPFVPVVDLSPLAGVFRVVSQKTSPEKIRARKTERAARDAQERMAMRGSSSGKPERRSNPERTAKRERKAGQRK